MFTQSVEKRGLDSKFLVNCFLDHAFSGQVFVNAKGITSSDVCRSVFKANGGTSEQVTRN